MCITLEELVNRINAQKGTRTNVKIAQDVKKFLWAQYDPNDDLIYPNVNNWDDLLLNTIKLGHFGELTYDETLSILFGLNHRNRIVEGLWFSMFERGIIQMLLGRLSSLDNDKIGFYSD